MKDSEAMMVVEHALGDAGLSVLRVDSINTGRIAEDSHSEIAEGVYKVVKVTVAVSLNHHAVVRRPDSWSDFIRRHSEHAKAR